jgi:hypothetical protein
MLRSKEAPCGLPRRLLDYRSRRLEAVLVPVVDVRGDFESGTGLLEIGAAPGLLLVHGLSTRARMILDFSRIGQVRSFLSYAAADDKVRR